MSSRLNRLAQKAARRTAQRGVRKLQAAAAREWSASELGRYSRMLSQGYRSARLDRSASQAIEQVEALLNRPGQISRQIRESGGIEQYALSAATEWGLTQLFRALGPLGSLFSAVMRINRSSKGLDKQLETAQKFLEAFGYEVISPAARRGSKKLDAALTILEQAQQTANQPATPTPGAPPVPGQPGPGPPGSIPPPPPQAPPRGGTFGPPIAPGQVFAPPTPLEESAFGAEIQTPGSSNVYSYSYKPEDNFKGTLYVTFKAWWPGQKVGKDGKRPHIRGPLYAYFDVDAETAHDFVRMSSASAGGAVWTYLRQKGTLTGHWFDYRLVQGAVIPGKVPGGVYIPRKITALGLFKRKGFKGYSLPNEPWGGGNYPRGFGGQPNRADPDRGTPNGGQPNRGSPNRGK